MNKKTLLNILKKIRLGSLIIALIVAIASIVIIIDATFFFKIFDIGVADSIISLTLIFDIIVVTEYIVIQYLTMYIDGLIEGKMNSTEYEYEDDTEDIDEDTEVENDSEDIDDDFVDVTKHEPIPIKDLMTKDTRNTVEKREDESGKFDPSEMTVIFTALNGTEYKIYGPRNDYRVENLRTNRVIGYYSNGIKYITYMGKCDSANLNVKKYWHEKTGIEIE